MNSDRMYSVVVPLYNEEENAPILIEAIDHVLKNYQYELILVDDFSTDRTVKVVKDMHHPHVVLIELMAICKMILQISR